jgi:ankyrin repeat protein
MEASSQDASVALSAEVAAAHSSEAAAAADLALHAAARTGDAAAVATLLGQPDGAARLKRRDAHERTPLHVACFANHVEVVNLLLSGGASANATAQVK